MGFTCLPSVELCRVSLALCRVPPCTALGKVIICRVSELCRVSALVTPGKDLFVECPTESTRQRLLHSAYVGFPVVILSFRICRMSYMTRIVSCHHSKKLSWKMDKDDIQPVCLNILWQPYDKCSLTFFKLPFLRLASVADTKL